MGRRFNPVLRQRSGPGTVHDRVEVPVEVMVRRAGPCGSEEAGEDQKAEPPRVNRDAARRDVTGRGHEQEERIDAALHQLNIIRDQRHRELPRAPIARRSSSSVAAPRYTPPPLPLMVIDLTPRSATSQSD